MEDFQYAEAALPEPGDISRDGEKVFRLFDRFPQEREPGRWPIHPQLMNILHVRKQILEQPEGCLYHIPSTYWWVPYTTPVDAYNTYRNTADAPLLRARDVAYADEVILLHRDTHKRNMLPFHTVLFSRKAFDDPHGWVFLKGDRREDNSKPEHITSWLDSRAYEVYKFPSPYEGWMVKMSLWGRYGDGYIKQAQFALKWGSIEQLLGAIQL